MSRTGYKWFILICAMGKRNGVIMNQGQELPSGKNTTMLVMHQRFGDLFLFWLVWQYSSVQTKYNKCRFKVKATYLQH
jgi:hypothetical protein